VERHVYGRTGIIGQEPTSEDELADLLMSGETWTVG
jgi:hypothetical protein